MGKKKRNQVSKLSLGAINPDVIDVVDRLKILKFLDQEFQTDGLLTVPILEALSDLDESYTGSLVPIQEIDPAIERLLGLKRCGMIQRRTSRSRGSLDDVAPEVGWETRDIRFAIGDLFLLQSWFPESDAANAIRQAAINWNNSCDLNLTETDVLDDHHIVFSAVTIENHAVGNIIAHGDYPGENNLFGQPLQVHFNANEIWSIGAELGKYDLVRVAMHELGHCLGLFHYPGTLMNEIVETGDDSSLVEPLVADRINALYP